MPVTPQSYLSPQSQPWGRYIEQSIASLEKGISINGQNSNNNLRQLNSSVQLLSQQQTDLASQQAYLNGLTTYTTTDATSPGNTTSTETLIKSLSLTFTLSRSYNVWFFATATGYCVTSATAVGGTSRCVLQIDSNPVIDAGNKGTSIGLPGNGSMTWRQDVGITNVTNLTAGSHTITANWYGRISPGSSGFVQILPATFIASIIS